MSEEVEPSAGVITGRTPTIGALVAALAKAQSEMEGASKDSINPHFRARYASLAAVWEACRGPLTKNGLAVLQPVRAEGARVTVTTILAHSSGEWISEDLTVTAQTGTPQGVGSAITYGRRYGLSSMVGIAPDDDDGQAAEGHDNQPEPAAAEPVTDSPIAQQLRASLGQQAPPREPQIGARVKYTKIAKEGVNDKGPWTLYAIGLTDGREGTTFSKSIYTSATELQHLGRIVTAKFDGKKLLAIGPQELVDERDDEPPF